MLERVGTYKDWVDQPCFQPRFQPRFLRAHFKGESRLLTCENLADFRERKPCIEKYKSRHANPVFDHLLKAANPAMLV